MDVEAVTSRLGEVFDKEEARIAERMIRDRSGKIPDAQLIEEIGLAIAVHRLDWLLEISIRRPTVGVMSYSTGCSGVDESWFRERLRRVVKKVSNVEEPTDLVVTKTGDIETGTFRTPGATWSYLSVRMPPHFENQRARQLYVQKHLPPPPPL